MNGLLQLAHVSEGAAPKAPLRELGKETLQLIEPAGTGRSEVQVIARMPGKPALYLGGLVRPVVIQDEVHGRTSWELTIYLFQELEKFLRTMTALALADDLGGGDPPGRRTARWFRDGCNRGSGARARRAARAAAGESDPEPAPGSSRRGTAPRRDRADSDTAPPSPAPSLGRRDRKKA